MKAIMFIVALFSVSSAHADGASTIASCFKSYLNGGEASVRARCLTAKFRRDWDKIGDDSGADPLLNAQDYMNSWKNNVTATVDGANSSHYKVYIGKGSERFCLNVTVDDANKIAASESCD